MTEYWLQKKTLGGWSIIGKTTLENFAKLDQNSGYSWRLVKAEVVEERLLEDHEEPRPSLDISDTIGMKDLQRGKAWLSNAPDASGVPEPASPIDNSDWGQAIPAVVQDAAMYGVGFSQDGKHIPAEQVHGNVGKIWMVNHSIKEKLRVNSNEVESYFAKGFVKGGPRTQFK